MSFFMVIMVVEMKEKMMDDFCYVKLVWVGLAACCFCLLLVVVVLVVLIFLWLHVYVEQYDALDAEQNYFLVSNFGLLKGRNLSNL